MTCADYAWHEDEALAAKRFATGTEAELRDDYWDLWRRVNRWRHRHAPTAERLEATREQSADLVRSHADELADVEQQLAHLAGAISKVGLLPALNDRLAATERRRTDLQAEIARIEALSRVNLSRIPALYRQMAFQLETALKTDVATAREVLRPLIEGARMVEEGGQVWVESETGRAAIAVGLSLGMVAGACITTKRRTLVS